jgi:hypothetical protein
LTKNSTTKKFNEKAALEVFAATIINFVTSISIRVCIETLIKLSRLPKKAFFIASSSNKVLNHLTNSIHHYNELLSKLIKLSGKSIFYVNRDRQEIQLN